MWHVAWAWAVVTSLYSQAPFVAGQLVGSEGRTTLWAVAAVWKESCQTVYAVWVAWGSRRSATIGDGDLLGAKGMVIWPWRLQDLNDRVVAVVACIFPWVIVVVGRCWRRRLSAGCSDIGDVRRCFDHHGVLIRRDGRRCLLSRLNATGSSNDSSGRRGCPGWRSVLRLLL